MFLAARVAPLMKLTDQLSFHEGSQGHSGGRRHKQARHAWNRQTDKLKWNALYAASSPLSVIKATAARNQRHTSELTGIPRRCQRQDDFTQ
jgi:hypothetical protein